MSGYCCNKSKKISCAFLFGAVLLSLLVAFSHNSVVLAQGGGKVQMSKSDAEGKNNTAGAGDHEQIINAVLDEYDRADEEGKVEALQKLFNHINISGCKISMDLGKRLSETLIRDFSKIEGKSELAEGKRVLIVYILSGCGKTKEAQEFVLGIIDNGPDDLRRVAMDWAHRSQKEYDLYGKYEELERRNLITKKERLNKSMVVDRERVRRELWQIMRETDDGEMFCWAGTILTLYEGKGQSPKELSFIFRRIHELGLDDTKGWTDQKLYWLDGEKCAKYLEGVKGDELVRAVEILDKAGLIVDAFPVVLKRRLMAHPNVRIREIATTALGNAIALKRIEPDVARKMVEERLVIEKDKGVRANLSSARWMINRISSTVME